MPLLPLEPFVYPENLLTEDVLSTEADVRWWVLQTRPRAEKQIARRFLRRSVPFFLPLYQKQWRKSGRLFTSHMPLFPGYLFLHGDFQARLVALETNLVARTIPVDDQAQFRNDLARVHHLMTTGASLSPEERLVAGTRVEILRGPFVGLEGKVLRRGKKLKLFVEVQLLQRGVSVEIESWMVQRLDV
jgi:transcription antitermination factor NusG